MNGVDYFFGDPCDYDLANENSPKTMTLNVQFFKLNIPYIIHKQTQNTK